MNPSSHSEIRELAERCGFAIDTRDVDLVGSLVSHASTFWKFGDGSTGASAFYESIWKTFGRSVHTIFNVIVTASDNA